MALPLLGCVKSLLVSLDVGSIQAKNYNRRSLAHAGCIFANLAAAADDPRRRGHVHMLAEALVTLMAAGVSDEVQEQVLRYGNRQGGWR